MEGLKLEEKGEELIENVMSVLTAYSKRCLILKHSCVSFVRFFFVLKDPFAFSYIFMSAMIMHLEFGLNVEGQWRHGFGRERHILKVS